ncbi:MAG: hypothetical protein D4R65_00950 [Verrucomicrobiaceae bacterium]|nr:MAG: hypothetical protein D4R65_00950 [Verrucomicrobiaceae bacterium]
MSAINPEQFRLLKLSAERLSEKDYNPYLKLRMLLTEQPLGYRSAFEPLFRSFFGMNRAHLGDSFLQAFFDHLFKLRKPINGQSYSRILSDLAKHKRKKGDAAIQFSFVSKFVAINDESQPIIDKHISDFFGISAPRKGGLQFRINGFIENLTLLKSIYGAWKSEPAVRSLLANIRRKKQDLSGFTDERILDLLVWQVGRRKLWKDSAQ